MTNFSVKGAFLASTLVLSFCIPTLGFCNIWEQCRHTLESSVQCSYEQVKKNLPLLTDRSNISPDPNSEETLLIADGYIVINPESIQSYRNPTDREQGVPPEFEFKFSDCLSIKKEEQGTETESMSRSEKMKIALDIIPSHQYFVSRKIGDLNYNDFITLLEGALAQNLSSHGFMIDILRPRISISAQKVDEINSCPPTIVLSTQFNDDNQYDMTNFCGGNICKTEFGNERQRARFVQSALTSKPFHSVELAACIMESVSKDLGVKPLDWDKAFFESEGVKNAIPISCETEDLVHAQRLESKDGSFNGIAMRNLFHNGIFAKAVVIVFPDMKWVTEQVESGEEMQWIAQYVNAITEGVLKFVGEQPRAL